MATHVSRKRVSVRRKKPKRDLDEELKELNERIGRASKQIREAKTEKAAAAKVAEVLEKGSKGLIDAENVGEVLDTELKRLEHKKKQMLMQLEFRKTPAIGQVLVAAGSRPKRKREVVLALSTEEFAHILQALEQLSRFKCFANDVPLKPVQVDRDIEKGDLPAYLLKCSVLTNTMHKLRAGVIVPGSIGQYADLLGVEPEEWSDAED